jgi:hypothetical protein
VWSAGEPSFLKYWLQDPADARGEAALEQEEGFSQVRAAAGLPEGGCSGLLGLVTGRLLLRTRRSEARQLPS